MAGSDVEASAGGLSRGWDRRDPILLRFADPSLERAYDSVAADPARQRLRAAHIVGVAVWASVGLLAPPLLGMPPGPIYAAALVNMSWESLMLVAMRRPLPLARIWLVAFLSTTISAISIVVAFGLGGRFDEIAATGMMVNAIVAISLVRIAAWLAVLLGALEVAIFVSGVVAIGTGGVGAYQTFLLIGLLVFATAGARYLESAERVAFAQGHLVADLHRRIDRLFRQYVSPDVAQALLADPARAELGGEVVVVSVLFADLRGYTAFSERASPEEVVALLNSSFGAAVPAVFAEGGTIVQFVGDALMAIFNAPLRQPDHAIRACRAGLALQLALPPTTGAGPRFRVGINTGPALVGNIGSAELRNFSALGDTTNVAARLQAYANPGSVVIGRRTYELVRDVAEVRSLGTPALKGKSVPTDVYELLGLA